MLTAEVLVTTSWTFVVENSYRLIQNVATNSTAIGGTIHFVRHYRNETG